MEWKYAVHAMRMRMVLLAIDVINLYCVYSTLGATSIVTIIEFLFLSLSLLPLAPSVYIHIYDLLNLI